LKIALISPNYLPVAGGTQVALHNIAKHLINDGHDVLIITRRRKEEKIVNSHEGVNIRSFIEYGGKLSFINTNLTLYSFLKKNIVEVDIIHQFHLLRFGLPTIFFSKNYQKPLLTSLMGTDSFDPEHRIMRFISPYLSYIMNNSTAVTSPSVDLARYAYHQGCSHKIHIIPHGINADSFTYREQHVARLREAVLHDKKAKKIILSVGRLHSIKRPDILLKAMSVLVNTYGVKNTVLLIVGDGPEGTKLKNLAHELNISELVEFHGHVPHENITDYYHCCDIFAFHSTYETFGIVLTEAMACGKPVVSTAVGAIPEVVDHIKTGFLVPPNNPEEFAKALKYLIEDESIAKIMGEQGRKKTLLKFSWRNICWQYLELYKTLL